MTGASRKVFDCYAIQGLHPMRHTSCVIPVLGLGSVVLACYGRRMPVPHGRRSPCLAPLCGRVNPHTYSGLYVGRPIALSSRQYAFQW